ncbi:MAG: exodeoxyribonuclease V subunit beta [Deltaproteobacteria bacterium]|nr:exodeoxyribonuclease V subunit beta [Deltaproteobacteria bacterium]
MKGFDILNDPLEGTNLTEASAGTGKTYAISGLFLRLVLEKNLSVNQILVVTFTEAATEELKERIRSKLRGAMEAFSRRGSEDVFLDHMVKKHGDPGTALRSLREALRGFDQAAIFTIHGFCRRMLHENAFESGSLFDTELVTDQENLKREVVDDFWRKHFYNASSLFVHYAINAKLSPDGLLSLLGNSVAQPYLKIIPQVETSPGLTSYPDSSLQEKEFRECFREVRGAWPSSRDEVEDILATNEGLNRNKYRKANVAGWIQGMDDYVASGGDNPALFNGFEKFTSIELKGAVKKNHSPPTHAFFELCENLKDRQEQLARVFEQRLLGLKAALFHYVQDELSRRKEEKNIQFFDDLLFKLHRALEEKGGGELARAMRMKFRAALIDEFQDTDPIQYAIFRKVFDAKDSILFLIGDPKQAIYGFRGADIFAYMDAAQNVESRYTLLENWRSEPDLISAINTIFAGVDHPFVYDKITFQGAVAATRKDPELLSIDGKSEPPLQLWFVDAEKITGLEKPVAKTQARELISTAVAAEISRLLSLGRNNKAILGKRALKEGDIAVLVRRNADARLMQRALSVLKIPSVLCSTGNLFDCHETLEVGRVLAGIAEPNREKFLKAALATDMIGIRGESLDGLMSDECAWDEWLVRFKRYHDVWEDNGFIRMFRQLLLEENILPRLMSFPDGERRNTNLLHLSEVLHQASIDKKLGMAGLLKWLSEQRDSNTAGSEEHQLRLESDENAVQLVTVHKSKGLEYPVVFYPFAWDGSRIRSAKDPFTFHDETDKMRLTLDLGSEGMDANRMFAEKEQLAENVRLLYVALTRAKNRCYLVWGRFNDAETSAPAYLLHQPVSREGEDIVGAVGERFSSLNDKDVLEDLETIQAKAGGTVNLSEIPLEAGRECAPSQLENVKLTWRKFSGNIDRSWRISSFSSLVSKQRHGADLADHDATGLPARHRSGKEGGPEAYDQMILERLNIQEEPSGIFAFPGGTKAGTLMHDIFEHLDFAQRDSTMMEQVVADKLQVYGFEIRWQKTLCDMIKKTLSLPLDRDRKDFILSRIENKDRLNELEFYFPLKFVSPKKLKIIFAKHACPELPADFPERIERLAFAPVRGFMKGFMDMVFQFEGRFYLVDWKSNFLGSRVEDYGQGALAAAMEEGFYVLQYYIYTLALHQYLRLRLPGYSYEKDFGGVFYVFLRGVDPDRGMDFGIFRDRPPAELINELSKNLIDHE